MKFIKLKYLKYKLRFNNDFYDQIYGLICLVDLHLSIKIPVISDTISRSLMLVPGFTTTNIMHFWKNIQYIFFISYRIRSKYLQQ